MRLKMIGIVDYGVGNYTSVQRAFQSLGYKCRASNDPNLLSESDIIVLPGVGAYPSAVSSLHNSDLFEFLRERAIKGHPILGLCLGMQLLANESLEFGKTEGLGLIPGQVVPLDSDQWHIGWNTLEVIDGDNLLLPISGESFYFNHSFIFDTSSEYRICMSRMEQSFTVGVRKANVVGLQFHPEKSQTAGRNLLKNLVEGLAGA